MSKRGMASGWPQPVPLASGLLLVVLKNYIEKQLKEDWRR